MLFPVEDKLLGTCRYSSPFGSRIHPITGRLDGHRGIDIAMPSNTPLRAVEDGVVIHSTVNKGGSRKGYGYYIAIKHTNGYATLYAHLIIQSKLKVGAFVKKGQIVAYSGNTGSSTGPHLHFEVHKNEFKFRAQVTNKDTAINPVTIYPKLQGKLGQFLGDINFSSDVDEKDELQNIKIKIHGKEKSIKGIYKDGTNYVPIRFLEILGYAIGWEQGTKTVTIKYKEG